MLIFYFRLSTSVDCKISFHNVQFVNVVNNKQVYILKTLFCVFFHFIYLNTSLFDTGTIKGFLFPHYLLPSYSGKGCLYSFLKNQAISIVSPKSVQQFSLETLTDSKVIFESQKLFIVWLNTGLQLHRYILFLVKNVVDCGQEIKDIAFSYSLLDLCLPMKGGLDY